MHRRPLLNLRRSLLNLRRSAALLLAATALAGCDFSTSPAPSTQWVVPGEKTTTPGLPTDLAGQSASPTDPIPSTPYAVRLDIWAVVVPRNTVSANEAFWKRVDENALPPDRYELLFKNGFRVGVARREDWDYFKDLLSRYPARSQLNALTVTEEQTVEVPVRRAIDKQTLSFFESDKPVALRVYTECDNIIQLGFVPAPRRTDAARIAITPVVRSQNEKLDYSAASDEKRLKFTVRQRLYELNLALEVPFGQFLVCSPSTDTARSTSIGRNFLILDGDVEQSEVVLLIVPTRIAIKEAPPDQLPEKKPVATEIR